MDGCLQNSHSGFLQMFEPLYKKVCSDVDSLSTPHRGGRLQGTPARVIENEAGL